MNITDKIALYQEFIKKCTSSEGSWSNYSQFSRIDKLIKAIHPDYSDLIYYSDPKFVRNLYQELLSLEKLPTEKTKDTFKTLGGGQYHNAMATYIRFLEAVKILSHVDMPISQFSPQEKPAFQIIYYGAPGTGKSHRIKKELKEMNVSKENIFRTTFHPDSDYSSFVGCYKPTMKPVDEKYRNVVGKDEEIAYSFVPQTFIKAYTQAYKKPNENVYLIIEEINRGNCAQIFGDLFQLLDRDDNGVSEYPIKADSDLRMYLEEELENHPDGIKDGELCLPSNLYIWATMNTSDQSLFPIDSAFKRRWDWEYEPIKYMNTNWGIEIGGNMYSWTSFQIEVNNRIFEATNSEDKMLGDFFVKPNNNVISEKQFINKVLFYLWNDVCKDGDGDIFKTDDNKDVKFSDLYDTNASVTLKSMMKNLGVSIIETEDIEEFMEDSNSDDFNIINSMDNSQQTLVNSMDYSKFSINNNGQYSKGAVVYEVIKLYCDEHKELNAEEIVRQWLNLGIKVPHLVETESIHAIRKEKTRDSRFDDKSKKIQLANGQSIFVSNQFNVERITDFITKVNAQDWNIRIEKV